MDTVLTKINRTSFVRQPRMFEIWTEGYRLGEQRTWQPARCWGSIKAMSLEDACRLLALKSPQFRQFFDRPEMRWWGCRIFDNEQDARKVFG